MAVASPTLLPSDSKKDRIISLLGQGISATVVAAHVDVDPSYVSQLLESPDVKELIAVARSKSLEQDLAIDDSIKSTEKMAIDKLKQQMVFSRTPLETARIFQILNGARRHAEEVGKSRASDTGEAVVISLPVAAVRQLGIQLNSSNQIVEIEGRTMAPMPSKVLPSLRKTTVEEINNRMLTQDSDRAAVKLDTIQTSKVKDFEVILDGVPCVI